MEIRVDIKLDNGSTDRTEIIGNITPEAILNLINKFTNLYNSSLKPSSQPVLAASQVASGPPAIQPQTLPPTQPNYQTPQKNLPKPKTQGTRDFGIAEQEYSHLKNESLTIKERLELFLNFEYKDQWFTSLSVKQDYDRIYGPINLSTVSTYLSRLYREDKLERIGNRNQRRYRLKELTELQEYPFEAVVFQQVRP
ncbi:MAG: hypothetical protein M8349_06950 [ANME-2 cluster archaeon]|nr:hypothetical protein [ANME-2 cluster archaeon]